MPFVLPIIANKQGQFQYLKKNRYPRFLVSLNYVKKDLEIGISFTKENFIDIKRVSYCFNFEPSFLSNH